MSSPPPDLSDDPRPTRKSRLSRRIYLPRIVGLGLGGLCVGSALQATPNAVPWVWALLAFNALLWPHLAYQLASRAAHPRRFEQANLLVDALLGGFWVVCMQGMLLPSVLIIAMLSMNNVATGGVRFFLSGVAANLAGALGGVLLLGWSFQPESNLAIQLACLPFLVAYPLLIGNVTLRLARELNRHRTELQWLSDHDALAGIFNRRFFELRIVQEFENFKRHGIGMALAVADIDHFKKINDTHGHQAGDAIIRLVGKTLREGIRRADIAARIGGDEFVVLMPFTSTADAADLALRLQAAFANAQADDLRLTEATISFGIAAPDEVMESYQEWMERADQALYRAKLQRRGSIELA
jgi:diguanylate cyclase